VTKHRTVDYRKKHEIETERYRVVFFSTPFLGTWSVFIPKIEVNVKDYRKVEEAIKEKIRELERKRKEAIKKEIQKIKSETKIFVRYIMGVPLYESDMEVLLSLLLEGPCKSVYELSGRISGIARSTCYDVAERLLSAGFIRKIPENEGARYGVSLLGFCAVIKEEVEHVLENRDIAIIKNSYLLPVIFGHWKDFEKIENLRNDVWEKILEYVWFELGARLSLLQCKYFHLTLEEIEEVLKYDLTRFIVFPWLYSFVENVFLLGDKTEETQIEASGPSPEELEELKEAERAFKSWKKFIKKSKREQVKNWIITLSQFDAIKKFVFEELKRLEKMFQQSIKTIKECSSLS